MRGLFASLPLIGMIAMLSGCGGGGSSGSSAAVTPTPTPTPTPAPASTPTPTPTASTTCSLRSRQQWAAAQLREWYLFPDTLPASLDPSPYASVGDYVDALTATARAQGHDRYFTYLTSIAEEDAYFGITENAYYNTGTDSGLGLRLATDTTAHRLFVIEAFEGGPGLAAGIDRGVEILAIGPSVSNLTTVSALADAGGTGAIIAALGADATGTTVALRVTDSAGTRTVTITKRAFTLTPVSARYGSQIINDGGRRVGYVNLRAFISSADPALRTAFAQFRAQGITDVVVDLRYNGGGLVSIAELLGSLLGQGRAASDVFAYETYRPEKSSYSTTALFTPQPESIAPTRIAFIGTGSTASASELVINAFVPYLDTRVALIGSNTYGKPVGQIAIDRTECDDRLRIVSFASQNSARTGNYYNGLASSMRATCQAVDDIGHPMGDPQETMTRQALDFIAGRSCTPITTSGATASIGAVRSLSVASDRKTLLVPDAPNTPQRDIPGLF